MNPGKCGAPMLSGCSACTLLPASIPRASDKVRLNRVTATLVGEEIAVSGSGTRKTTHRHVLGTATKEMAAAVTAEKGQPTELTCTLEIPGDAAPTFRATDNRVQWRVLVHFDVESWPDLEEALELDVLPA